MTRMELRVAVRRYLIDADRDDLALLDARAARAAHLERADADLTRCGRCGAWRAGACRTPFCHVPHEPESESA